MPQAIRFQVLFCFLMYLEADNMTNTSNFTHAQGKERCLSWRDPHVQNYLSHQMLSC